MTADIITLKPEEEPAGKFICAGCHCESFTFHLDKTVECCGCHERLSISIFDGMWIKDETPIVTADKAEGRTAVIITNVTGPDFVLRRALEEVEDIVHVVIMRKDGSVLVHGYATEPDQMAWIRRRLEEADHMFNQVRAANAN